MGNFSYICPKCKKNIRDGEVVHFRHIRHGVVLGETVGRHDAYGRVWGKYEPQDPNYRKFEDEVEEGYMNTNEEICRSEFNLPDSKEFDGKLYEGKPYTWIQLRVKFGYKDFHEAPPEEFYDLWRNLPEYVPEKIASGTSAYHEYCWRKMTEDEKNSLVISELDPDQGCGSPRKLYFNVA